MKKNMNEKRDRFNRRKWLNKGREMVNFIEAHKSGFAAHDVEEVLFREVIEMGYGALGIFLVLCGDGDEGEEITLAQGRKPLSAYAGSKSCLSGVSAASLSKTLFQ